MASQFITSAEINSFAFNSFISGYHGYLEQWYPPTDRGSLALREGASQPKDK